jgi:hypothetical protein
MSARATLLLASAEVVPYCTVLSDSCPVDPGFQVIDHSVTHSLLRHTLQSDQGWDRKMKAESLELRREMHQSLLTTMYSTAISVRKIYLGYAVTFAELS